MRFKRLRFLVGVVLIIFIFVIGNIIIFGKLMDKNSAVQTNNQDQNIILVDPKKSIQDINNTLPIKESSPNVTESVPLPEPVVVHTTRKTRAS